MERYRRRRMKSWERRSRSKMSMCRRENDGRYGCRNGGRNSGRRRRRLRVNEEADGVDDTALDGEPAEIGVPGVGRELGLDVPQEVVELRPGELEEGDDVAGGGHLQQLLGVGDDVVPGEGVLKGPSGGAVHSEGLATEHRLRRDGRLKAACRARGRGRRCSGRHAGR